MYLNASMMMLDSGRIPGITIIATDIVNANSIKPKDGSVAMVRFPGTWVIMSESSVQSKSLRRTQGSARAYACRPSRGCAHVGMLAEGHVG
jgi:hypothetical protein